MYKIKNTNVSIKNRKTYHKRLIHVLCSNNGARKEILFTNTEH